MTLRERHDSLFDDDDEEIKSSSTEPPSRRPGLFDLPAEIRIYIYNLVFDLPTCQSAAFDHTNAIELNPAYRASSHLLPLLTCRQFHHDACLLAYSRTLFVVTNPYIALSIHSHLLARLRPLQLSSLRHVALVADSRHFRALTRREWPRIPLSSPSPSSPSSTTGLTELTIVLRKTSYWHYLFDSNAALVALLRDLDGVRRLTFVRNGALIKGTMLTWYNRLVKLILKVDLKERFGTEEPHRFDAGQKEGGGVAGKPERSWWEWEHCRVKQTVCLDRREPKRADLGLEEYKDIIRPLLDELVVSMQDEEYDPDPMSRVSA